MNSQYFSEEQVKAGELDAFLKSLRAMDYGKGRYYNDVHIKPEDCGAYVVEWEQMNWDGDDNKGFAFVDYEHVLMLERQLPDDSYVYCFDEDDYNDRLSEWLAEEEKDGFVWKKNEYGRWYEEGEQRRWREMLEKHADKGAPTEDVPEEFA